jgi:hypothetical protein
MFSRKARKGLLGSFVRAERYSDGDCCSWPSVSTSEAERYDWVVLNFIFCTFLIAL